MKGDLGFLLEDRDLQISMPADEFQCDGKTYNPAPDNGDVASYDHLLSLPIIGDGVSRLLDASLPKSQHHLIRLLVLPGEVSVAEVFAHALG